MASIDAARGATVHSHADRRSRLRDTWPLQWRHVGQLVAAYLALTAVFVGMGELITHPLKDSALVRRDLRIEQWFADHRTAGLNRASFWGSQLSETGTKIVVTAVVGIAVLVLCKRWYEALLIAVPLILEAAAFLTITLIVGRPRPDVPRLDGSPVGSSFPSGHTAAAACYAGVVVVLVLHHHRRWVWGVGLAVVAAITAIVGWARMYRGMHHLTDVVAGALLGTVAVVVATVIVRRAEHARQPAAGDPAPVAPAR
jgi:undecaprenyl-diphosphatase